jgi:hypothetical protein
MKMWVRKMAYRWLGHVFAMVGHGKLIQQARVCSWLCYFMCEEGFIFWGLVVGRSGWSCMQRPCAKLCTMSPSTCGWLSGSIISHSCNMVMMHAMWNSWGVITMLVCDHCFRGWYMDCFTPPFMKVPTRNQCIHDAPNRHVLLFCIRLYTKIYICSWVSGQCIWFKEGCNLVEHKIL